MMEYKGYVGQVQFDDEANIFHGDVINIRDVITFEGRSVEELRQALEDSVEDYLEFCAELGKEPERPSGGRRDSISLAVECESQATAGSHQKHQWWTEPGRSADRYTAMNQATTFRS